MGETGGVIFYCTPTRIAPNADAARQVNLYLVTVLLVGGLFASAPATADVYQFIATDGTPHFSDSPTDSRFRLLLRSEDKSNGVSKERSVLAGSRGFRQRFEAEISAAALTSQIDADLLHAVIETESNYNPRAVSPKGALGLMQLMPQTARRYGVTDPFDAAQNVRGGAQHLRELLDQFSDNKELALAAYNAGAGAVRAHGKRIPPFAETLRYVPKVLQSYNLLRSNNHTRQD
ncbi:MAG: transglycosylase SLT domain-containing protein [Burkholderiaceae bacterium]